MRKTRLVPFLSWVFLSLLLVVGCNQTPTVSTSPTASPVTLTISAAASLKPAFEALKPLYSQQQPSVSLTYNYGSSGNLQQQIEQGAPADLFISAAKKQMDALEKKGLLLEGTRKTLLSNELVLIAPANSTNLTTIQDIASDRVKKLALGEPKTVPAGQYAEQALTALKLLDEVKPKIVYAKDVRAALNYVETGNVDAGMVYRSDAKGSNQVKIVATLPSNTHDAIVYPSAVIKTSKHPDMAKQFQQFLSGESAKSIFEQKGFTLVNP